jgi:hypothetical protein
MKHFLTTSVAALSMLLATGLAVKADSLPPAAVAWTYNFSPASPSVTSDQSASAGVSFTNEPTKNATGSSDIVATNLKVFTPQGVNGTYTLTNNGAYSMNLVVSTFNDATQSPVSATFTVTGKLSGIFTGDNSNIKNMFTSAATQVATLGGYTFTLSDLSYTPPGPVSASNVAGISAHIEITPAGPSPAGNAPEPGTLLLSGLGLSFLGGAAWRKRRQARVAVAV